MSLLYVDPSNKIDDSAIPPGANINQTKLQSRARVLYSQIGAADPTVGDFIVHRSYTPATVLAANVTPDAVPAGGTKTMVIDIKKSTGGGAWATILTGVTTLTTASTARTPVAISLSGTPTLIAGDLLRISITAGGSGGTGVQGFLVDIVLAENGA